MGVCWNKNQGFCRKTLNEEVLREGESTSQILSAVNEVVSMALGLP